jgi:mono/diheme cytochrome c family protein
MKTWIRRGLVAVAALIVLLALLALAGVQLAQHKKERRVEVAVQAVPLPADTASIERGRYLFASRGCADCHGASGGGRTFIDDGKGLKAAGPNITRGSGSVTLGYAPVDWVRTLRHGVKPDGRPVFIMPSEDYNRLTDADVGAIVAYVQSLAPADGTGAVFELPLPVRALYGFGAIKDAAAKIDHALPPQQPVPEGVTVEHGQYVANMCLGCHGAKLEGGKIPGGPPDWPAAARLVPGGPDNSNVIAARYADADALLKMFKTGQRPDGSKVAVMPFEALSKLSDTDARALHLYLKSLSAKG